jgi:hypothetical protein
VINQFAADPPDGIIGLLFILSGLPVYYLWVRNRAATAPEESQGDSHRADH